MALLDDKMLESFLSVYDVFESESEGKKDRCYVSRSYDSTTHFETTVDEVLDLYKRELEMTPDGSGAAGDIA